MKGWQQCLITYPPVSFITTASYVDVTELRRATPSIRHSPAVDERGVLLRIEAESCTTPLLMPEGIIIS